MGEQVVIETIGNCFEKNFKHKTFEERVVEYDDEISTCDFDWGEPAGKEIL